MQGVSKARYSLRVSRIIKGALLGSTPQHDLNQLLIPRPTNQRVLLCMPANHAYSPIVRAQEPVLFVVLVLGLEVHQDTPLLARTYHERHGLDTKRPPGSIHVAHDRYR